MNEEVIAKIDKALQHVHDLCQRKVTWTMRVPADVERDSDLILCEALESARQVLSAPVSATRPMNMACRAHGCQICVENRHDD